MLGAGFILPFLFFNENAAAVTKLLFTKLARNGVQRAPLREVSRGVPARCQPELSKCDFGNKRDRLGVVNTRGRLQGYVHVWASPPPPETQRFLFGISRWNSNGVSLSSDDKVQQVKDS